MLKNRHEKVIYENELGERIELAYSFPYFFQELSGTDGITAEIIRVQSIGQDGATITNVRLMNREITLTGVIKGSTKEEIAVRRSRLLRVFSPKSKGKIIYEYGSIKRQIECQIEVGPKFSKNQTFKYQNFIIDILCPDPYWTELEPIVFSLASFEGGFSFPMGFPINFGQVGTKMIVNNSGDVETPVFLKLTGKLVTPVIKNITTGAEIKINKTIEVGEVLEIGTEYGNKYVRINGQNAFHYVDENSEFFSLQVRENQLEYTAAESDANSNCVISFYPRYVGV